MPDLVERLRKMKLACLGADCAIYAEAADEIERMRSERAYIIGFNDGWESAHEQQPGDERPFAAAKPSEAEGREG